MFIAANLFPRGEPKHNSRKRLCAYRGLVFWLSSEVRRKERIPLPSCLVSMVRATFPPTENEEEFADYVFAGFCYGELPDDN